MWLLCGLAGDLCVYVNGIIAVILRARCHDVGLAGGIQRVQRLICFWYRVTRSSVSGTILHTDDTDETTELTGVQLR